MFVKSSALFRVLITQFIIQVYTQVNTLFKGAPHLLEEFKTFLPSDGGPLDFFGGGEASWPEPETKRTTKSEAAPVPQKRRKRPQEKEIQPALAAAGLPPKAGGSRVSWIFCTHSLF